MKRIQGINVLLKNPGKPYRHKFIGFRVIDPLDVDSFVSLPGVKALDVRTPEEYKIAHISGAINIPFDSIDTFVPEKGSEYVLYCRSGKKSEFAYFKILEKYPHVKLAVIRFGFQGWQLETKEAKTAERMKSRPRQAVVLLTPVSNQDKLWGKYTKMNGFYMPVQIMTIADVLDRNGFEVHIIDGSGFDFTKQVVLDYIEKVRPAVVGITTYTATAYDVWSNAKLIKDLSADIKIIAGGIHCSLFPERSLTECPSLDAVCFGEGEVTMLEFCRRVITEGSSDLGAIDGICIPKDGKPLKLSKRKQIPAEKLEEYMAPAFHLIPMEYYIPPAANYYELPTYSSFVSRGCPFRCSFCNASNVFGTLGKYRSVDSVIDEAKYLQKHYNMKGMYYMDGTFASNKLWVEKFCKAIADQGLKYIWFTWTRTDLITMDLAEKMKKSGCWKVGVGIESGNQQSLDIICKGQQLEQMKKGVRCFQKAGIEVNCSYILGLPGETVEHVENTLRFAKSLKTESAIFFLPVPMPGTNFFEAAKKYGGLRTSEIENWSDYSTFNFKNPLYINPLIGKERSLEYYHTSFSRFFLDPGVIWRNLKRIKNLRSLIRLCSGFKSVLYFFKPSILVKSVMRRITMSRSFDRIRE